MEAVPTEAIYPPSRAGHNLGRAWTRRNRWCGMEVLHIRQDVLPGRAWHDISADRPVFSMVVAEVGGRCETRRRVTSATPPWGHADAGGHCSLIPAKLPVWGYSDQIAAFEEIRVFLDPPAIAAAFGDELPGAALDEPKLMIFDPELQHLARLMAASSGEPDGRALWGESLLLAAIARVAGLGRRPLRWARRGGLSARQIQDVTQYILDNLDQPIRLDDLSAVAGLSVSQFARNFKVSTGEAPHRWLLNVRLERAKVMLGDRRSRLADVALATGFSEQSHFTRAFAAATGVPPGRWRRARTA